MERKFQRKYKKITNKKIKEYGNFDVRCRLGS